MATKLNSKDNLGFWAFTPLLVFLVVYFGGGCVYLALGRENPFDIIPMIVPMLLGVGSTFFMGTGKFDDKMNRFARHAGKSNVVVMCIIYLLAGAFAGSAKAMGGVDSVINFGLTYLPSKFLFAGVFIISCFIALAMGTSMGTCAAMAPVAFGLAEATGGNVALALAAVVGGAMFGDNLSIISDTTIAACQGMVCNNSDKFKMNAAMAAPAAIISIILFAVMGTSGTLEGPHPYELIKVVPYLAVLIAALCGVNVFIVLISGTLFAGIVGIGTGSLTLATYMASIADGVAGMRGLVITSMLFGGMAGVAEELGGIQWALDVFSKKVSSRAGAEFSVAGLVSIIDGALGNNTVAIIVSIPLAKQIAAKYDISRKRMASILDVFSCAVQGLTIHGGQLLVAAAVAGLGPLDLMPYSFYQILLAVFGVLTILFVKTKTASELGQPWTDEDLE